MSIISGKKREKVPVEVVILNKAEIESVISYKEALEVQDEVYKAIGGLQMIQPGKEAMYVDAPDNKNFFVAMPVFMKNINVAGIKWLSAYYNQQPGIPMVWGSVIVLNRPENGQIFAIMDGTAITNVRSATHSAIAGKYLAKKDSKTITMIGSGNQAITHLYAFKELFPLEMVKVYNIRSEAMTNYMDEIEALTQINAIPTTSVKEACEDTDIICVVTTASEPVVMEKDLPVGCFVTGLMGFIDLDPEVSKKADKWIIGDRKSDEHLSGTVAGAGVVDFNNIYAEMGEIAIGAKPGRESDEERIVYTHFGMGAHDIMLANFAYNKALKQGLGTKVNLI